MYTGCMSTFLKRDRDLLASIAQLGYCNPFLPDRIALEKAALGREFVAGGPVWSATVSDPDAKRTNVILLQAKTGEVVERSRERLAQASEIRDDDLTVYEESVHYLLYTRYVPQFIAAQGKWRFYREFLADWNRLCAIPG